MGIGEVPSGVREVWVIEQVESFGSKLQGHAIGHWELAVQGEVGLPGAKTAQNVSTKIADGDAVRRRYKRLGIEALSAWVSRSVEIQRLPGNQVGANGRLSGRGESRRVGWGGGTGEEDAIGRPVMQERGANAAMRRRKGE